ncbi:vacuolar protein, partial [Perkinsus olseni]
RVLTGLHKLATRRQRTDVELRASLGEISFCLVTHEGAHPLEVSAKSLAVTTSRSSMKAELAIGQATAKVANYTFINLSTGEDEGAGFTTTFSLADSPAVRIASRHGIDISLSSAIEEGLRTVSRACSVADAMGSMPKRRTRSRFLRFLPDTDIQLDSIGLNLYSSDGSSLRVVIDVDAKASKQGTAGESEQSEEGEASPTIINLTSAIKISSLTSATSTDVAPRRVLKNREGTLITVEGKVVSIPGEKISVLLDTVRFENALALSLA